jgi:hypothetical protein
VTRPVSDIWKVSYRRADTTIVEAVSTELTRRRAVDLLRVATALCPSS